MQQLADALQRDLDAALAAHEAGNAVEAERRYMDILRAAPDQFDALQLLGLLKAQSGRLAEAESLLRRALAIADAPLAHFYLGNVLNEQGRSGEALDAYTAALARAPDLIDAAIYRCVLLSQLGRGDEALAGFDEILAKGPDAEAFYNRANALKRLGRVAEAIPDYEHALALKPDFLEAWFNRGNALRDIGRNDDAVASYDRALALEPHYLDALNNRGVALLDAGRVVEAVDSFDKALAVYPEYAEAANNRGNALMALNRLDDAVASFDRAIAVQPDYAEAHNNRGIALAELKRSEEAIASYSRALALDPGYDEARYNRGVVNLFLGRMAEGWRDYEHRWAFAKFPSRRPPIDAPHWNGEPLSGRSIVVYNEQGLGDTIQFCRYLPLLVQQAATVTFLGPQRMFRLLSGLPGNIRFASALGEEDRFDFQCAMMSVPGVLGTDLGNIPHDVPYLAAEDALVAKWRERIGGNGFRIGICWQGNPEARIDVGRSIPLRAFEPLSRVNGVRLISLQKQHGLEQLRDLPAGMTVETLGDDFDEGPDAFVDTAAAMASLDLVVTSDTSCAHLAGALAHPAWVALRYAPDWRWLPAGTDSPWYPTLRLFRQPRLDDWSDVFKSMAQALAAGSGAIAR